MSLTFEWDPNKARTNLAKHGVRFEEAATIFGDHRALTIPDPLHSQAERRFITIGTSPQSKILVAVHTNRGNNIRIISARLAGKNERRQYEEIVP